MTRIIWALFIFAMVGYVAGDYYAKLYGNTGRWQDFTLAMIGYVVTSVAFLWAMNRWSHLAILGSLWNVSYAVLTLVVAFGIFGEKVSTSQAVGLGLGVVAVFLLTK